MAVQLKELYDGVNKKNIKLIAGAEGICRVVEWIHIVENLEISTFLEGGELVFVTGIGLNNMNELMVLVQEVNRHQVSGVVINVGPYIHKIPREIIDYCNAETVPLFEVPWSVHMAQIMRQFCLKITEADRSAIELGGAIKNAIYFPKQSEMYLPFFNMHGMQEKALYGIASIELEYGNEAGEKQLHQLQNKIGNFFIYNQKKAEAFVIDGRLVILFVGEAGNIITEYMEKIRCQFLADNGCQYWIGIGETVNDSGSIYRSYFQAEDVIKIQKRRGIKNKVYNYEALGVYQLLLGIENREILKKYYASTLLPLENYDDINATDYVALLAEYLKNGGSIKQIAEARFVHRNTINYKLHKIEEILGCNLSDAQCRTEYSIALKVKDIL